MLPSVGSYMCQHTDDQSFHPASCLLCPTPGMYFPLLYAIARPMARAGQSPRLNAGPLCPPGVRFFLLQRRKNRRRKTPRKAGGRAVRKRPSICCANAFLLERERGSKAAPFTLSLPGGSPGLHQVSSPHTVRSTRQICAGGLGGLGAGFVVKYRKIRRGGR